MAIGTLRRVVLHYRRAKINGTKETLHALLASAVHKLKSPVTRIEPLTQEGVAQRLLNQYASKQQMLCGNLVVFAEGASQLLLRAAPIQQEGEDVESFPLEAFAPPKENGAKSEWIESILYFCVRGDNALILQSRNIRVRSFEDHLDWLLRKGDQLKDGQALILADHPGGRVLAAIKRAHVKTVSLGMPLLTVESEAPSGKSAKAGKARVKVQGPIIQFLKSLKSPEIDKLKLDEALNGNIEATISLTWMRKTNDDAQNVLDKLAIALRNIEGEDVTINLNDGTLVRGDELKFSVPVDVEVRDEMLVQSSVFKAMRDAMNSLLEDKAIPL